MCRGRCGIWGLSIIVLEGRRKALAFLSVVGNVRWVVTTSGSEQEFVETQY